MRSRHILGCLAESIVRTTTYRPATWHGLRARLASPIPPASSGTPRRRSFATSVAVRSEKPSLKDYTLHVLRHVANSVAVCTVHAPDAAQTAEYTDEAGAAAIMPLGLTMSSLTSLSLCPTPVVTFNIAVPSRTETALRKTRHFMVHILSGDAKGARVADVFRTGNAHPSSTLRELQRSKSKVVWPSSSPGTHKNSDQPFLQGPGVLYIMRCKLLDEPSIGLVPVRDHVVVLGEVLEIIAGDAETADSDGYPRFGLLYGNQNYRQLDGVSISSDAD